MKYGGKMVACIAGGLALCTAASAITAESSANPYQTIIDRNVFSLKPPTPPPDPAEVNKAPALKITLTGITTILGNKRVLMKTAAPQAKPGEPPKTEQSYILTEGQRDGDIEVLEIDDKAGSVKVNNAGSVMTLTFEKDGAKLPATQAPVPLGVPGAPPARAFPQPPGATGTPSFQLPTRIPRLQVPGAQSAGVPLGGLGAAFPLGATAPGYGTPGFLPGNTTLPAFQTSGTSSTQNLLPGATPTPQYSLEEQHILIEAARQVGGPGAALLPPTALNPKANLAEEPATPTPAQNPASQAPVLPSFPGRPLLPGQY